jgi:hypothetical protein
MMNERRYLALVPHGIFLFLVPLHPHPLSFFLGGILETCIFFLFPKSARPVRWNEKNNKKGKETKKRNGGCLLDMEG